MADIVAFKEPAFLEGHGTDDVMKRMLQHIPDGMDKSEGGFVWDLVYPTAIEKSQVVEFTFAEVLRNLFPMWASGDLLDAHGYTRGMTRKAAVAASGMITITGAEGTQIDAGTEATTTAQRDGDQTISFRTTEDAVIGTDGRVSVGIVAVVPGTSGNVAAGTINRFEETPLGVGSVINEAATNGGIDEEDDEAYRARIVEYDQSQGESFVGSISDYRRWALSVVGVGSARVVEPEDDSGLVTIILTDSEGRAASQALCQQVYDFIMCDADPLIRKAPIGASLRVMPPSAVNITIAAHVVLNDTVTISVVKAAFIEAVNAYFAEISDGFIRYSHIGRLLVGIKGVIDYDTLTLNGGTANITFGQDELAMIDEDSVVITA